jgi:hypothetical protein
LRQTSNSPCSSLNSAALTPETNYKETHSLIKLQDKPLIPANK